MTDDRTLGELYRRIDDMSARFLTFEKRWDIRWEKLDQAFVTKGVYEAQRAADRDDVNELRAKVEQMQSRSISWAHLIITAAVAIVCAAMAFAGSLLS